METTDKPIAIREVEACRLVRERAKREDRTFANAACLTIREALGQRYKDTDKAESSQ